MCAPLHSIDTLKPAAFVFQNFVRYDFYFLYYIFVPVTGDGRDKVDPVHIIKAEGRGEA
jgi:hypothetical protein